MDAFNMIMRKHVEKTIPSAGSKVITLNGMIIKIRKS